MSYCSNCGTLLNEKSKFCSDCGQQISTSDKKISKPKWTIEKFLQENKPNEKGVIICPRCLGKGHIDEKDIIRLSKEGIWMPHDCTYCDSVGQVNIRKLDNQPFDSISEKIQMNETDDSIQEPQNEENLQADQISILNNIFNNKNIQICKNISDESLTKFVLGFNTEFFLTCNFFVKVGDEYGYAIAENKGDILLFIKTDELKQIAVKMTRYDKCDIFCINNDSKQFAHLNEIFIVDDKLIVKRKSLIFEDSEKTISYTIGKSNGTSQNPYDCLVNFIEFVNNNKDYHFKAIGKYPSKKEIDKERNKIIRNGLLALLFIGSLILLFTFSR